MEQNGHVNGVEVQPEFSRAPGDGRVKDAQLNADSNVRVMDYKTDFPELGNTGASANSAPVWGAKKTVPKIRSSNVSQIIHLPPDERRAAQGGRSTFGSSLNLEQDLCNTIAAATKTSIVLSESRDGTLTVMFSGTRENIEESKRQIIAKLQQQAQREITVPREHHRVIIGREGKMLSQLEVETNCKITFPRPNTNSEIITIIGPRDGIDRAAQRIIQISEAESKRDSEHLVIEKEYWPWIRGPHNANLLELQSTYNVRINIPPPSANNNVIVIDGEKEGVATVSQKIRQIYNKMKATAKKIEISIPRSQHRYIIGRQGDGIADILQQTNVAVEVPREDANSDMITLRGETGAITSAVPLVYQRATSNITRELKCPLWLHRYIIGMKGASIQSIVENHPKAKVDFVSENETIIIDGPPEDVNPVEQTLKTKIDEMVRDMTFEIIKVSPQHHRYIVGKKGMVVNGVKDKYDVQIIMPKENGKSDEIKIEGHREGVRQAAKEIKDMADRLENERTKDLIIEQRFHRLLIGQAGASIGELRKQFAGVQFFFPEQGRKSDIVQLRGPKDAVEACAKHVTKLVKTKTEQSYQVKVPIFKEFHRAIIGKGGQNIRRIRSDTGCRIELPDENSSEVAITVTGREQDVKKAVAELKKIENELAQIISKDISIAHKLHARMLGGGRRMIADISQECGCVHINFHDPKKSSDTVVISGPKDDVEKAEKLLLALAKDRELSSFEDSIKFNPNLRRFLIGSKGAVLKKLRDSFHDVRIMVPRDNDEDLETIHLVGKEDDVKKAKIELCKTLKLLEETGEINMTVDPQYHQHFVIRNAQVLREIQEETGGCTISFPKISSGSDQVTIKGAKNMIEEAKKRIETIVEDLRHQTTEFISVPSMHHRMLLTRKLSCIQDIQRDFRVQMKFPDRNTIDTGDNSRTNGISAPDAVAITGRVEQIKKAREALTALIPIEVTVSVPNSMHRSLIGKGGADIRAFQDMHDVSLKIPHQDESSDLVYLSGTADAIASARKEIEEKVAEYNEAQFTVTVDVPIEFHSKIIGVRGSNIRQYRTKYGVNVYVPSAQEANNNGHEITIQGPEAKALEAKADIEKFVQDLNSMVRQEIKVAPASQPRIIGRGGKGLIKIQEDYKVEVRFPRSDDEDPSLVIIMGKELDDVLDAIDHIKNIEEEFMQDYVERYQYEKPTDQSKESKPKPQQVQISNAPWNMNSAEDFPTMGGSEATPQNTGAWGRPR